MTVSVSVTTQLLCSRIFHIYYLGVTTYIMAGEGGNLFYKCTAKCVHLTVRSGGTADERDCQLK